MSLAFSYQKALLLSIQAILAENYEDKGDTWLGVEI
jgi:hypothetical protein